jgi:leucyl aminopeptidase
VIPSIPKLGLRNFSGTPARGILKNVTHLAIPFSKEIEISKSWQKFLEKEFSFSFKDEFLNSTPAPTGKAGELFEIVIRGESKLKRIYLVGVGERTSFELRKIGSILGRKAKGGSNTLLSLIPNSSSEALIHFISMLLATYTWNLKTGPKPELPTFEMSSEFKKVLNEIEVLTECTWLARDLIHTPSNIKSPEWMADQAKKLAKGKGLSVKIKSGKAISEFGGLRAVGNSSRKNPPHFVEISYRPRSLSKRTPHVVLVGKGITFDTGGVSLKRPYDMMTAMKSDMAGSATVLLTLVAAAKLGIKVKVTGLLMLAENALSGTSQRPSDVIKHYGGTTVEVINTDAEGRLVLADGLAYADKNLNPDYLIDIATLTGAATLGLSRHFSAMYTRDQELAKEFHEIGEYIGDRTWHMPLVDDYQIALESDIADYNHTADKYDFQAGSVTAALFLEKFIGKRRWIHLDIAGPARSDADAGENPKGGTGYGVRLLTKWLTNL